MEKNLLNISLGIVFDISDMFLVASAATITISIDDYIWIENIYDEYGNCGLNAAISYILNTKPLAPYITDKYNEAYSYLMNSKQEIYGIY